MDLDPWYRHKTSWIALPLSTLAALFLVNDSLALADREFARHDENLMYWFDPTGQSDFAAAQKQAFQPIAKSSMGFGFTHGTLWVRLQLPPHQKPFAESHWLEFDLSHWRFIPGQMIPPTFFAVCGLRRFRPASS